MIQSRKSRTGSADELMERASEALVKGMYFECERLACKAMDKAYAKHDFGMVARIALPLQEARRQRRLMAVDANRLEIFDEEPPGEDAQLQPGCIVICDPSVGADARRVAQQAFDADIPIIAFACEPLTQAGLMPVVVVGPTTIRTQIPPPKNFTPTWCLEVIDALSAAAIQTFDPGKAPHRQVEDLINKVNTLPESEELHQKLAQVAHDLAQEADAGAPARRRSRAASEEEE